MAYGEGLAERIRELVGAEPGLTEKPMFGGLAFLINGNVAVAASGQGESWSGSIDASPMNWSSPETLIWSRCADGR